MPVLDSYYPKTTASTAQDYHEDQLMSLIWLRDQIVKPRTWESLQNALINATVNTDGKKFLDAPVPEKYLIIDYLTKDLDHYQKMSYLTRTIESLRTNGILTKEQESELYQTHYYATLFKAVQVKMPALNAVRGTITGNSAVVRLAYESAHSYNYTQQGIDYRATPAANLTRDVGTYTYRDVTTVPYAAMIEIDDHAQRDWIYNVFDDQVERLGYKLGWQGNYNIDKVLYDSGGATALNTSGPITLAEFRTGCSYVFAGGYTAKVCMIGHTQWWTGFLGDTTNLLTASAYGSTAPIQQAQIPVLFGVRIYPEIDASASATGKSYWTTTADSQSGILVDNEFSGVFVQRFTPIIERFRIPERQMNAASVTWQFAAAPLYTDATCPIAY